jgi:hypothetical protein
MDAIQQDVEPTQEETLLSDQEREIERIAQKVGEEHEIEGSFEEQSEEVVTTDFSAPLIKKGDQWFATAKVNGESVDVEWDEVLAQYQKNTAADKRLQEAAQRQRELEDYEAKLNAYRKDLEAKTRQPSQDADNQQSPSSDATDALYEQYHDALFQGDESKASAMLKKIRAAERPQEPSIDVNTIVERTKAEMREEENRSRQQGYELRRQQAVAMFNDEYSDIAGDSSLLAVADRRSAELYQENPTRDPWDIMQECGEYARDWIKGYAEKLGGASSEVERKERKQNMEEVTPTNVKASIGEDEVEVTYSDIISEMRESRGQFA